MVTRAKSSTRKPGPPDPAPPSYPDALREEIALRAYYRFQERSSPGHEVDDWLAAEREVLGERGRDRNQVSVAADRPSSQAASSRPRGARLAPEGLTAPRARRTKADS